MTCHVPPSPRPIRSRALHELSGSRTLHIPFLSDTEVSLGRNNMFGQPPHVEQDEYAGPPQWLLQVKIDVFGGSGGREGGEGDAHPRRQMPSEWALILVFIRGSSSTGLHYVGLKWRLSSSILPTRTATT